MPMDAFPDIYLTFGQAPLNTISNSSTSSQSFATYYHTFTQCRFSWTRPQVQARAHPNVLKASAWLNNLYHVKSGKKLDGVDLSVPLTYADRFRIRHPGGHWGNFPPHVDSTYAISKCPWSNNRP